MKSTKNKPKRILVSSGSYADAGKSTLIAHLIKPTLLSEFDSVRFISVEEEGRISTGEDEKFAHRDSSTIGSLLDLNEFSDANEAVLLEIGSQNFNSFLAPVLAAKNDEFFASIDKCIYPIADMGKIEVIKESLSKLLKAGVEPEKMFIVFNKVSQSEIELGDWQNSLETTYQSFVSELRQLGINVCTDPIPQSMIYEQLRYEDPNSINVATLASLDRKHFLTQAIAAQKAGDTELQNKYLALDVTRRDAKQAFGSLLKVFEQVFPEFA